MCTRYDFLFSDEGLAPIVVLRGPGAKEGPN